jgi:DNA mismatch repair protein MutS2
MRVDEAKSAVDKKLDEAFLAEEPVVLIIHGMGTSALRNAVREYLKTSRYVASFRSGDIGEGGEGVTIVTL